MGATSESDLRDSGVPATAIVKGLPSRVEGDRFLLQILLDVQRANGRPYEVNYVFPIARMGPDLVLGMQIPVLVDPGDPRHIAVQWDAP